MGEKVDSSDIFIILQYIEKKTGLFLLNRNLDYLYSFVSGIKFLAETRNIQIKNIEQLDKFRLYLKDELNEEYENTMGWYGSLHGKYGSKEGFEKFFEYLSKFKKLNEL
ncbi:MAG: hypothetical protein K8R85_10160 [Bacteroidetes bacterium]|nr:hypothetical protein [Bacteroidota bacterium]